MNETYKLEYSFEKPCIVPNKSKIVAIRWDYEKQMFIITFEKLE